MRSKRMPRLVVLTRIDGETAEIVRIVGQQQDGPELTIVSLAEKSPIADAVGRGAPVIVESRDALDLRVPRSRTAR